METNNYYNEEINPKENEKKLINNETKKDLKSLENDFSEKEKIKEEKYLELANFLKNTKNDYWFLFAFNWKIEKNFENFLIKNNLPKNFIWNDKEILDILEKYIFSWEIWKINENDLRQDKFKIEKEDFDFFKENYLSEINSKIKIEEYNNSPIFSEKISIFLKNASDLQKMEFFSLYNYLKTNQKFIDFLPDNYKNEAKRYFINWENEKFLEVFEKNWYFINLNWINKNTDAIFNIIFPYQEKWKQKIKIDKYLPDNKYINILLKEKNLENFEVDAIFLKDYFYWWTMWLNLWEKNIFIISENENKQNFIISNEIMHAFLDNIWFKAEENILKKETWLSNIHIHEFLSDYSSIKISPNEEIRRHLNNIIITLLDPLSEIDKDNNYNFTINFHKNIIKELLWEEYFKILEKELDKLMQEKLKLNSLLNSEWDEIELYDEYSKKYEKNIDNLIEKIFSDIQNKKINYNWRTLWWIDYLMVKNSEKWNEFLKLIYEKLKT